MCTQSSLSKRIAELEDSIGTELFDRSSQRARLTEAGHRLMPMAAQMLDLKERLKGELAGPATLRGTIRFGISELGALTWLPRFVTRVRAEHPQVILQPHVDLSRRLERQVARGELDFAAVTGPPEDANLKSHLIAEVHFVWVAAPGRVRSRRVIGAAQLSRHPVITMTEGSALTRSIDAWANQRGIQLQRIVASNSLMAIVGLSMADIGISFLPEPFVRPWVKQGVLVALRSNPPLPVCLTASCTGAMTRARCSRCSSRASSRRRISPYPLESWVSRKRNSEYVGLITFVTPAKRRSWVIPSQPRTDHEALACRALRADHQPDFRRTPAQGARSRAARCAAAEEPG
jgi:DNA-binding transcriptional LysR family regulator